MYDEEGRNALKMFEDAKARTRALKIGTARAVKEEHA
jgi:hypothetical protein